MISNLMRIVHRCAYCSMILNPGKQCAGCHAIWYCSQVCQKKDWIARHKKRCKNDDFKTAQTALFSWAENLKPKQINSAISTMESFSEFGEERNETFLFCESAESVKHIAEQLFLPKVGRAKKLETLVELKREYIQWSKEELTTIMDLFGGGFNKYDAKAEGFGPKIVMLPVFGLKLVAPSDGVSLEMLFYMD